MNKPVMNELFSDVNTAPTASPCNTSNPCTQNGCTNGIEFGKQVEEAASFAAPLQQGRNTQVFQSAPSFLC